MKKELAQEGIEAGRLWVTAIPTEDLIKVEKEKTERLIRELYFDLNYNTDTISLREHTEISKRLQNDPEEQLKMYEDVNRYLRIRELVKKRVKLDLNAITAAELEDLHHRLWAAKTQEDFEMALCKIPARFRLK